MSCARPRNEHGRLLLTENADERAEGRRSGPCIRSARRQWRPDQFRRPLGQGLRDYFYPKDDTPGCTKEAIGFSCIYDQFKAAGIEVIGVSKDSAASHDRFKKKHALVFPLGSDAETGVVEAFGAWVEKSMYGKKYMGIDRSTFLVGSDGRIARIWRKVSVPGHVEEVLRAAKELPKPS